MIMMLFSGHYLFGNGVTGANILQIAQQHVDLAQHFGSRIQLLAVQAVDRQAGCRVGGVPDVGLIEVASEAVLGAEDGDQLDAGFQQRFDVTTTSLGDTGLIGEQPHSAVGHEMR